MKNLFLAASLLASMVMIGCRQPAEKPVDEIPGAGGDIPVVDNPWTISPNPIILSRTGMGGYPKEVVITIDRGFAYEIWNNPDYNTTTSPNGTVIYTMTSPMSDSYIDANVLTNIRITDMNDNGGVGSDIFTPGKGEYTQFKISVDSSTVAGETYLFLGSQANIKGDENGGSSKPSHRKVVQYLSNKIKVTVVS